MKERGGQEMPPPQEAHIISNIQGMDMGRVRLPRLPFAHITPSHKQPMRQTVGYQVGYGSVQHLRIMDPSPLEVVHCFV